MKRNKQLMSTIIMIILTYGLVLANNGSPKDVDIKTNTQICNIQFSMDSIPITGNTSWQLIESTSSVNIYSIEIDCIDIDNGISMKNVLLKIENLTSSSLTISWDNILYYDGVCTTNTGNPNENHIEINVAANLIVEGSCLTGDPNLRFFIEMIGMTSESLTSFELDNLIITTNQ